MEELDVMGAFGRSKLSFVDFVNLSYSLIIVRNGN